MELEGERESVLYTIADASLNVKKYSTSLSEPRMMLQKQSMPYIESLPCVLSPSSNQAENELPVHLGILELRVVNAERRGLEFETL